MSDGPMKLETELTIEAEDDGLENPMETHISITETENFSWNRTKEPSDDSVACTVFAFLLEWMKSSGFKKKTLKLSAKTSWLSVGKRFNSGLYG